MTENADNDDSIKVRSEYVYIGPKFIADLKLRFGKWLDERRRE